MAKNLSKLDSPLGTPPFGLGTDTIDVGKPTTGGESVKLDSPVDFGAGFPQFGGVTVNMDARFPALRVDLERERISVDSPASGQLEVPASENPKPRT